MAKLKTGRHTSAIKAVRQAERRTLRNRVMKKGIRSAAKDLYEALGKKDKGAPELLAKASSAWDKAAKTGAIHWKAAARKKSRMARATLKAAAPAA